MRTSPLKKAALVLGMAVLLAGCMSLGLYAPCRPGAVTGFTDRELAPGAGASPSAVIR